MSNVVNLAPFLKFREVDSNGIPLAGGQLFSYVAGTTIPSATYTDSTGATANTNPVVLDSSGRANIWIGSGFYKFVLEDINGNLIWTEDNVSTPTVSPNSGGAATIQTLLDNQSSPVSITGFVIDHTVNQCVTSEYTIIRSDGTNFRREHGSLVLLYDTQNGWSLTRKSEGADALNDGNSLTITAGGQVQYISDSMGGTYAGKITWKINTAFAAEGI